MCVVSMIMDHYHDKWQPIVIPPPQWPSVPGVVPYAPPPFTREDIDDIRRDVEELRKLLERAREYDKRNNEPDCELEEKKRKVRELAEQLGVKIDFL